MKSILILFVFLSTSLFAQKEESISLKTETGNIHGKLISPKKNATKTVALIDPRFWSNRYEWEQYDDAQQFS